jgi:hypothetical protein
MRRRKFLGASEPFRADVNLAAAEAKWREILPKRWSVESPTGADFECSAQCAGRFAIFRRVSHRAVEHSARNSFRKRRQSR